MDWLSAYGDLQEFLLVISLIGMGLIILGGLLWVVGGTIIDWFFRK